FADRSAAIFVERVELLPGHALGVTLCQRKNRGGHQGCQGQGKRKGFFHGVGSLFTAHGVADIASRADANGGGGSAATPAAYGATQQTTDYGPTYGARNAIELGVA